MFHKVFGGVGLKNRGLLGHRAFLVQPLGSALVPDTVGRSCLRFKAVRPPAGTHSSQDPVP